MRIQSCMVMFCIRFCLSLFCEQSYIALSLKLAVDFLPLLKQGDSFYKTVKPDRKNVLTGIDISIMPCATRSTYPFSYSKRFSTFRTIGGDFTATRTSLGRVSLIHDFKTATCVLAFVGQLSFQFKPACIVTDLASLPFLLLN